MTGPPAHRRSAPTRPYAASIDAPDRRGAGVCSEIEFDWCSPAIDRQVSGDDSATAAQQVFTKDLAQQHLTLRIKRRTGLVEQPERMHRTGEPRERQPSALAGRQPSVGEGAAPCETAAFEQTFELRGLTIARTPEPVVQQSLRAQIFKCAEAVLPTCQVSLIEHMRAPDFARGLARAALPKYLAGNRSHQASYRAQQCCFSRSIGAGQPQPLARMQFEADVLEEQAVTRSARQAFDREKRFIVFDEARLN